jgi:hypothetical protein
MAQEHLTRDLRITRLVGADQPTHLQPGEKEKSAEREQGEDVGRPARAVAEAFYRFRFACFRGQLIAPALGCSRARGTL